MIYLLLLVGLLIIYLVMKTKDWINLIPPGEPQNYPVNVQTNHPVDSQACVSFSACHCIESQMLLYGDKMELSERFLAKMSGTTVNGNTIDAVFKAINKYGLVSVQDWPELTTFSWDEFYADIPPEVVAKGQIWLSKWSVKLLTGLHLDLAPGWTILQYTKENHIVERLNQTQFFDSYENLDGSFTKTLTAPILSEWTLLLTPRHMSNTLLVKKGSEYGFYLPATNEQAMIDKALNTGYPLATINNGQNIDWPNVVPDIVVP